MADFVETYSTSNVGTGSDADAERDGGRRQRRQQLHVHVRAGFDRRDHGRGPDDHGGDKHQDLRWDDDRGGRAGDHVRQLARQRRGRFRETYSTPNAGTGLTLTPSGTVEDGNDGNNYTYTFVPVSTGVITAEALTITAVTNSKTYDGTTSAAALPVITSGSLQGSDTADFVETYSTQNVGTGLTLTPSGVVNDGNGGNNYTYTFVADSTGVITAEALTITAVTNTKTYDGTTSAAAVPVITSGSLGTGDTADFIETYNTPNVGTGLTLTPSGVVNDGNGGNNYTYTFVPVSTGVITAEALTITAVFNTKTYDGDDERRSDPRDHLGQPGPR